MNEYIEKARGFKRLTDIAALPVLDQNAFVKYEGSISKCGDNADWDWGMYPDENGEWVLMEADGAGCIYNFTQHRYPTSAVPTFRFYFDNSPTPQFEIKPCEFGEKYPFIKPLADKFVGPEDNGRGPIWVVRSFVPMEFTTHCKVTSDIKLEGADKALGQGGWGHVTYHLYDNADGLCTFTPALDVTAIAEKYALPLSLSGESSRQTDVTVAANSKITVFEQNGRSTVTKIGATADFAPELLENLWIYIEFDGEPCVEAPFGTFFGCEYGKTPAVINTALLTSDNIGGVFENRYPMPFFESVKIEVENRRNAAVTLKSVYTETNAALCYNKETTGLFRSSKYYEKTKNIEGKNSIIADVSGNGSMVYGVITGEEISCGCEGDVRVFIDGVRSPIVESDGSESWGSYGWGFVCPPQCNPFSAYDGVPDINDTWSELRLTFTDNYPFRSNLRLELEHGCQNDGGGFHSGQVFYYGKTQKAVKKSVAILPDSVYYNSDGDRQTVKNRFENGIHENYESFVCVKNATKTQLTLELPAEAQAVVLKRVCLQNKRKMEADVFVNGQKVTERRWLFPDSNEIYSFLEDDFIIPKRYISGHEKIVVEIVPITEHWNDCGYIADII